MAKAYVVVNHLAHHVDCPVSLNPGKHKDVPPVGCTCWRLDWVIFRA